MTRITQNIIHILKTLSPEHKTLPRNYPNLRELAMRQMWYILQGLNNMYHFTAENLLFIATFRVKSCTQN